MIKVKILTLEIKKILQNTIEEEDKKTTSRRSTCRNLKEKAISQEEPLQNTTTRYSSGENEEEDVKLLNSV
jgi:hypothetical protein